jgi:hypothetical protein
LRRRAAPDAARYAQERQALIDFFEAARLHDTTVLSNMGTATFEPRSDGIVQQFDIESCRSDAAAHGKRERRSKRNTASSLRRCERRPVRSFPSGWR